MTYGEVLTALDDPTRRRILELLRDAPLPVGELARHLPVSRPAVSQHLKVLADARLVEARAEGTRRVYQICPEGLEPLRAWLETFWKDALRSFEHHVHRATKEKTE
jgi:DNA-binding transcriptional ArsR family regulator